MLNKLLCEYRYVALFSTDQAGTVRKYIKYHKKILPYGLLFVFVARGGQTIIHVSMKQPKDVPSVQKPLLLNPTTRYRAHGPRGMLKRCLNEQLVLSRRQVLK